MDAKRKASLSPSSLSSASSEAADQEILAKKGRTSDSRKVCLVCGGESDESVEYIVFILDINDSEFRGNSADELWIPKLRIDVGSLDGVEFSDVPAFCVLGSTLYMIGGLKSVFTFDLSSSSSNLRVEKNKLNQIPPMHHAKPFPLAIATPDSTKLIVFSASVWFVPPRKTAAADDDGSYFELYDPASGLWRKLPQVCDNWGDEDARRSRFTNNVHVYTFISKSVLFLETDVGMFSLDLELIDRGKGWKQLDSLYGYPHNKRRFPRRSFSFSVVGDGLLLTCFCAYDIGSSTFYEFPESASIAAATATAAGAAAYPFTTRAISLLDVGDGECSFCIAQMGFGTNEGINEDSMCPYLIVDVYRCDLIKYNEEKDKGPLLPGTSIIKSFRFLLDACTYDWGIPLSLFSI